MARAGRPDWAGWRGWAGPAGRARLAGQLPSRPAGCPARWPAPGWLVALGQMLASRSQETGKRLDGTGPTPGRAQNRSSLENYQRDHSNLPSNVGPE